MSSLDRFLHSITSRRLWPVGVAALVLFLSLFLGKSPSTRYLVLLAAVIGGLLFLRTPQLGLLALIAAALVVPLEFSTGTEVALNAATLFVPVLFGLWLVEGVRRRDLAWVASRVNRPLILFLLAGVLSLLAGNALWEPSVPKSDHFWLVQWAQWAIFAFGALAFWLTASLIQGETWLERLTWAFLLLGGSLAVLVVLPVTSSVVGRITTTAITRAPFWVLLAALAGGQLLFNHELQQGRRWFLVTALFAVFVYAFVVQREAASNWVGVVAAAGLLAWLRFPHLRWPSVALLVSLALFGLLFPAVYEFAGGEAEWILSGGSRLALIGRVVGVTMRNPITGLGPASYRNYANIEPLSYRNVTWMNPRVSSHNNYVDIFAHVGLVGLGLFAWFAVEVAQLGRELRERFIKGFAAGYVNGMLAAGVASLVIMMLADWILPFVYNIGFPGFQASLLVWMFLGGLVAVKNIATKDTQGTEQG